MHRLKFLILAALVSSAILIGCSVKPSAEKPTNVGPFPKTTAGTGGGSGGKQGVTTAPPRPQK